MVSVPRSFQTETKQWVKMLEDFERMATQFCLLFSVVVFLEKRKEKKEGIRMMRDIRPSNWLLYRHCHSEIGSPRARHIELLFPLAPWEPEIAVEEETDLFLCLCESNKMKGTELPWQILTCISTVDVQSKCLCIHPHNEVGLDLLRNWRVIFG